MSLKRVADELGLSPTTVSRALNGYPEVAEATRLRVEAAAARLNYKPHPSARRLALGRTDAVGIVFPITPSDLGDFHFLTVAAAMVDRFAQGGIDLVIISASAHDELDAYQRAIDGRRVDAFVVPRTRVHDARLELLSARGVPFVAYGRTESAIEPHAWLDYDNEAGTRLATERLLALGHKRIGYLGAPAEYNFAALRYAGFSKALAHGGVRLPKACALRAPMNRRSGYDAMMQLLALPQRPTAVLVDNHLAGVGAVHAVLNAGLRLGEELSLIVYDGVGEDSVIRTAITSVSQPTAAGTGTSLAEMMLALLGGAPPASLQRLCDPVLEIGTSDGPPTKPAVFDT